VTEATPLYKFCRGICRIVTSVVCDLKVYGLEHVPDEGGALIISNHESYLDPAVVGVQVRRPFAFMAKSELFANPLFGRLISKLGAFPVRQGHGDRGAIEETIRLLQDGHLLTIFPEGSRTEDGNLMPIQKGVALIVKRAKVPIVPAVIVGSFRAWPKGKLLFGSHPVRVQYGPPLDVSHMKADDIVELIDATFRTMLNELRARVSDSAVRLPPREGEEKKSLTPR
jgi:1-acyl-sn-glycerol-3-phosphate acyltransferase